MKFTKAPRMDQEPTNYHPPPGHYQLLQQQLQQQTFSFPKKDRFAQIQDQLPPPGQYYAPQSWIKKMPNRTPQQIRVKKEQAQKKTRAIPSIPSNQRSHGFQDMGNGILALKLQQKQNALGPGYYQLKQPFQDKKGKAQRFALQHSSKRMAPRQPLFPESVKPRSVSGVAQKIKPIAAPSRRQQPQHLNLEYIVQRQKQKKGSQIPPPGAYYNAKQFSSFNVKQKQVEFQNFESSQKRVLFNLNNLVPGPGQYQIESGSGRQLASTIPKERRNLSYINNKIATPGPGSYLINQGFCQTQRINKISAFGPGQYNLAAKRKRKARMVQVQKTAPTTAIVQGSQLRVDESEVSTMIHKQFVKHKKVNSNFSRSDRVSIEIKDGVAVGTYNLDSKRKRARPSFDRVSRFPRQNEGLGPGSYQVRDQNVRSSTIRNVRF